MRQLPPMSDRGRHQGLGRRTVVLGIPALVLLALAFGSGSRATSPREAGATPVQAGESTLPGAPSSVQPVGPAPRPSPFGVHRDGPLPRRARPAGEIFHAATSAGASWLRVNAWWDRVEPTEGARDWTSFDLAAEEARRTGIRLLVTVRGYSQVDLYRDEPGARLDAFTRMVEELVARYRGTIGHWQLENEITAPRTWKGGTEEYLEALAAFAGAVRGSDPTAAVVLGSVGSAYTVGRIGESGGPEREDAVDYDAILERGAPFYDVVDLHLYHRSGDIPARVASVRDHLRARGLERPVWASEAGGPDPRAAGAAPPEEVPADLVRRYVIALAAGVEVVFWHPLRVREGRSTTWSGMALFEGARARPALGAYRTMARLLAGVEAVEAAPGPEGTSVFRAVRPDGEVFVAWADSRLAVDLTGIVSAPGGGPVRVVDVQGQEAEADLRRLPLGPVPVFLLAGAP